MFGLGIGMAYMFLPNQAASMATISREQTRPGQHALKRAAAARRGVRRGDEQYGARLGWSDVINAAGVEVTESDRVPGGVRVRCAHAFIGALFATRVPDEDAAVTMVRRTAKPAAATDNSQTSENARRLFAGRLSS